MNKFYTKQELAEAIKLKGIFNSSGTYNSSIPFPNLQITYEAYRCSFKISYCRIYCLNFNTLTNTITDPLTGQTY